MIDVDVGDTYSLSTYYYFTTTHECTIPPRRTLLAEESQYKTHGDNIGKIYWNWMNFSVYVKLSCLKSAALHYIVAVHVFMRPPRKLVSTKPVSRMNQLTDKKLEKTTNKMNQKWFASVLM